MTGAASRYMSQSALHSGHVMDNSGLRAPLHCAVSSQLDTRSPRTSRHPRKLMRSAALEIARVLHVVFVSTIWVWTFATIMTIILSPLVLFHRLDFSNGENCDSYIHA